MVEVVHSSPVSGHESNYADATKDSDKIADRPISSQSSPSPSYPMDDPVGLKDERRLRSSVEYEVDDDDEGDQP